MKECFILIYFFLFFIFIFILYYNYNHFLPFFVSKTYHIPILSFLQIHVPFFPNYYCMNICIWTYISIYISECIYVYVYIRMYIGTHSDRYINTHIYIMNSSVSIRLNPMRSTLKFIMSLNYLY